MGLVSRPASIWQEHPSPGPLCGETTVTISETQQLTWRSLKWLKGQFSLQLNRVCVPWRLSTLPPPAISDHGGFRLNRNPSFWFVPAHQFWLVLWVFLGGLSAPQGLGDILFLLFTYGLTFQFGVFNPTYLWGCFHSWYEMETQFCLAPPGELVFPASSTPGPRGHAGGVRISPSSQSSLVRLCVNL